MAKDRFEDALAKLEAIVKQMEGGDMPLEESIKAFEQGIRLVQQCTEKLNDAQRRVEVLLKADGAPDVAPFLENDRGCD